MYHGLHDYPQPGDPSIKFRTPGYVSAYSESRFHQKLTRYAKAAGHEVVEKALRLFYAAQSPDTPRWAKTAIYGALGYFIFPLDAIPDFAALVGYTDDLGVLAAALATVSMYITDDIKERSRLTAEKWFGPKDSDPYHEKE